MVGLLAQAVAGREVDEDLLAQRGRKDAAAQPVVGRDQTDEILDQERAR